MAQGQIFVSNGDSADDFVTLNDLNAAGAPVVSGWDRRRLNATDKRVSATVEIDGTGLANVKWYAERADDATVNNTANENPPQGGEIFPSAR